MYARAILPPHKGITCGHCRPSLLRACTSGPQLLGYPSELTLPSLMSSLPTAKPGMGKEAAKLSTFSRIWLILGSVSTTLRLTPYYFSA